MLHVQVIIGSTRQNRFGEKPAQWIFHELQKHKEISAELLDLRNYPLPFFDEPMSPAASEGKYTHEIARKWADKIGEGDAYIIVTPEYNHGYSAVLKNAMDYVYKEWNKKPVAFVSYGGISGGIRAVEQLRQVAIELQLFPIRQSIHIPFARSHIAENGEFKSESLTILTSQANAMIPQLLWFADLLKKGREEK